MSEIDQSQNEYSQEQEDQSEQISAEDLYNQEVSQFEEGDQMYEENEEEEQEDMNDEEYDEGSNFPEGMGQEDQSVNRSESRQLHNHYLVYFLFIFFN